jgi:glutamine amidotransferase
LIAVADYGLGNLRSVQKAFEFTGHGCVVTRDIKVMESAEGLVLPCVGAFGEAVRSLRETGLDSFVKEWICEGRPFLGICLGLQMLFEYSGEGGEETAGLGILEGSVRRFPEGTGLKIPQIGWNSLDIIRDAPLFEGVASGSYAYFVHSYYVEAKTGAMLYRRQDTGLFSIRQSRGAACLLPSSTRKKAVISV